MKKRFFAFLIMGVMFITAACGTVPSEQPAATDSDGVVRVGLVQFADNPTFTAMREEFIRKMDSLGFTKDKLAVDYKNANGDAAELKRIFSVFQDEKKDLIVTIGTQAALAAVNSSIPVFFIGVSDPVGAGIVTDMQKPDKNCTGTASPVPVDKIFGLAAKLTPKARTFGILLSKGEADSAMTVKKAEEYMDANGLKYKEAVIAPASEAGQAVQSLAGSVDALFLPDDSVAQSAMAQIAQAAQAAKLPVYGCTEETVAAGALATVCADGSTAAGMTADLVFTSLRHNMPPKEIYVRSISDFTTVIGKPAADALGVAIPDEVSKDAKVLQ